MHVCYSLYTSVTACTRLLQLVNACYSLYMPATACTRSIQLVHASHSLLLIACYNLSTFVTACTPLLQLVHTCYSFYTLVTSCTRLLQLLHACYSLCMLVTAFTRLLQLVVMWWGGGNGNFFGKFGRAMFLKIFIRNISQSFITIEWTVSEQKRNGRRDARMHGQDWFYRSFRLSAGDQLEKINVAIAGKVGKHRCLIFKRFFTVFDQKTRV
jgi:hypothetical protein